MALRAKALIAIILAVVILSLTVLPSWSMAFLILLGMIASAVKHAVDVMKTKPILPVYDSAPAVDAPLLSVDAPVDAPAPAVDALALSVDALIDAPAISVDAPVDAPALAVDALALSVDALIDAPAISVDAPVDAPALAVDALALSVDAPVDAPALAVDDLVDAPPLATAVVATATATATGIKMRKPESSSISSPSSEFEYDVFLSFSGPITSDEFTDNLCQQLKDVGIKVVSIYGDDKRLRFAEEIELELKGVIKRSRISIAILSKDYASSKWCLNELVQMWECREFNGQTIIPIFYDVSPFDVRHQAGDFGSSFSIHEIDRVDSNTIEKWREVLRRIGGLSGFILEKPNGLDGQLVKEVVARVGHLLKEDDQVVTDELVGIDFHVEEVMRKLGVAYSEGQAVEVQGEDVRILSISGMGGIGKTTLAKAIYNSMHNLFDASSFLENSSSEGPLFLQRKLIADLQKRIPAPLELPGGVASLCRNAKVFLVLDDVWDVEQIRALVKNLTWFGPGSRIIVTTRDKSVLSAFDNGAFDRGRVEEHEVELMSDEDALELFRKHAFQGNALEDVSEYDSLSKDIVKAIGGLPSAIERHASFLRGNMNIDIWKTTLDLLQKHPKDRKAALQISYAQESELESSIEDDQLTSPVQDSSIN